MDGRQRARGGRRTVPDSAAQVEAYQTHMNPTALGSGARVLNAYPLVHAQGVYEGLRAAAPNQRVLS